MCLKMSNKPKLALNESQQSLLTIGIIGVHF